MVTLINLREVRRRVPRSKSTIYTEIQKGTFPRPFKAGRSSFWRHDEVDDLIAAYSRGATEKELRALCIEVYRRRQQP